MLDQTSRYSDLNLKEADLIAGGKHVLGAYKMKPADGFFDYIGTAAHFCAESGHELIEVRAHDKAQAYCVK